MQLALGSLIPWMYLGEVEGQTDYKFATTKIALHSPLSTHNLRIKLIIFIYMVEFL